MGSEQEMISREMAEVEIAKAVRRLALLHLAFAETLVRELGEEEGRTLVVKAIRSYGMKIGGKARREALEQGLPLTPESFTKVPGEQYPRMGALESVELTEIDGENVFRGRGCLLAKVWKEYGGEDLGRLYCLTDPAQFMAFNPNIKFIHLKTLPDGDDCCELVFRDTTLREREDFAEDRDWSYIDRPGPGDDETDDGGPLGYRRPSLGGSQPMTKRNIFTTSAGARIALTPPEINLDRDVTIRLAGFAPNTDVTVEASLADDADAVWRSRATFRTDWVGAVDLAKATPVSGSYREPDAHGLLWSMAPVPPERFTDFLLNGTPGEQLMGHRVGMPFYADDRADVVELEAIVDGEAVATARLTRHRFPPGVRETEIREGRLRGRLFEPASDGPHPGVMLIPGSGGGVYREQAALLAANGFIVLNLPYFNYDDLQTYQVNVPVEYFGEALEWFQKRLGHTRIAVTGASKGGEGSLVVASHFPEMVAACAPVVPGDIYLGAWDESNAAGPAWTLGGEALPWAGTPEDYALLAPEVQEEQLAWVSGEGDPETPFNTRRGMEAFYVDRAVYQRAAIPIERIRCPILLITGTDDQSWPSEIACERAVTRLKEKGFSYPLKYLGLDGAGHLLIYPGMPTVMSTAIVHPLIPVFFTLGGRPDVNAHAQREHWKALIQFLHAVLG